jgi:hypothetical protein
MLSTFSSHQSDVAGSSQQQNIARTKDISSVSEGFTTSSTSETSQKYVSSSQSSGAVDSVNQQKLTVADSVSSIQQGGSTVQQSTVISDKVRESKAAVTTVSEETTTESKKTSVTSTGKKDGANREDLHYKYSGPIKEQCICEICTCG